MQVLVCLADHASEVVPKEKLIQSVWSDTFVTDDVLTRSISELRKVFGDDAKDSRFIQTIPRSGYRLIAPVSDVEVKRSQDSDSAPAVGDVVTGVSAQRRLPQRRLIWMASISALVIAAGLVLYLLRDTSESSLPALRVVPFTSLPGEEITPVFSPDGNQIAFSWGPGGPAYEIYVKLVGEGGPRQLTHSGKFNFSPVWSPNGQQIAFVRRTENETALFSISAYGEQERKLFSFRQLVESTISWSLDGKSIAFSDHSEKQQSTGIFLLWLDTLEKRALTSPLEDCSDAQPAFSPDGRALAFVRGFSSGSDLYVVSVSGGEPRRLTFENTQIAGLTWTEDSREIVFSSNRTGSLGLWRLPVLGGNPQRLPVGGYDSIEPSISRQGHRLTYTRFPLDSNIYRIGVTVASETGNPPAPFLASTRVDSNAQFSPDGKRIAFQSDRAGSQEIWLCDIDGGNCNQLTSSGSLSGTPRWAPDGKRIVCDSVRDGKTSIYAIDLETRGARCLVADPFEERLPSWSRDGHWVYFGSRRSGSWQIWKVPAEGGEPLQVTQRGGSLPFESPDARFVYYSRGPDVAGVWRVPIDGGEEILILDQLKPGMSGNWAVVDDGIYFIKSDKNTKEESAIMFFDFPTGRLKEIAKLGLVNIQPLALAVSPDRSTFLYTVWEQSAGVDIMLVENFR